MILADYILILVVLGVALVGVLLGFGKGIKILTKGIIGILISIVNCYFLFGMVIHIGFVKDFMNIIVNGLTNASNWFCNFLLLIRIEMVTVAVLLFAVVMIIRKIIIAIIANIVESDHVVFRVINKSLGALLSVVAFVIVALIVLQIVVAVQHDSGALYSFFKGSFFHLDEIYLHNPLLEVFDKFVRK
ncbi:MAG: hypothetical protein NC310_01175 [Roseburia sp.]|nr:hypothetical protein [Anaeroplasma bactoclasticum]MCM1195665.1 hypothetical protein [Roseburia sp.]